MVCHVFLQKKMFTLMVCVFFLHKKMFTLMVCHVLFTDKNVHSDGVCVFFT